MSNKQKTRNADKKAISASMNDSVGQGKGTVLLRNPLPKYSFNQPHKNSKGSENIDSTSGKTVQLSDSDATIRALPGQTDNQNITLSDKPRADSINGGGNGSASNGKPVNKVCPISKSSANVIGHSASDSQLNFTTVQHFGATITSSPTTGYLSTLAASSSASSQLNSSGIITAANETVPNAQEENQTANSLSLLSISPITQTASSESEYELDNTQASSSRVAEECSRPGCVAKVKHLEEEKQMLKNQLEVQLQV